MEGAADSFWNVHNRARTGKREGQHRVEDAWREAPIAWLSGVRRSGKTTLANQMGLENVLYVNCDLPSVEDRVRDPQLFFESCTKPVIVFDEIHQLRDPARLLKIGADLYPSIKILATGSSTLAASRKFLDTLAGQKRAIHLTPVTWDELPTFGVTLEKRLLHGGLPQALLANAKHPSLYREWMDSFFARDVQRLFGLRDMNRFNALFEYVLRQSGGQFEVTRTASALGISRPTVDTHLQVLEITHGVTVVRPFFGGGQKELVRQPKVYGFDTGFVSFVRGWDTLRSEDLGALWEHLVLEHLQSEFPHDPPRYWRDTTGNEVDFVRMSKRDEVEAIECKWNPNAFDGRALSMFRRYYPHGQNYVVTPGATAPYQARFGALTVTVCTPTHLRR